MPGFLHCQFFLFCLLSITGCSRSPTSELVIYTSQDKIYAEPIFRLFEKSHGIRIKPVFDSEAVKTAGLANRLLAEKSFPQADLFWNNEEFHTRRLMARGVLESNFSVLGYRSRQLLVHREKLDGIAAPTSLLELTNSRYAGKIVMAYPLFGTTATHLLVLKSLWGAEGWERWCRELSRNQLMVVDGNSICAQQVNRGERALGLTDSDDIRALADRSPLLSSVSLKDDGYFIPNTVAIVTGSRNRKAAADFVAFLQSLEVRNRLILAGAIEAVIPEPKVQIRWDLILSTGEADLKKLHQIFTRS